MCGWAGVCRGECSEVLRAYMGCGTEEGDWRREQEWFDVRLWWEVAGMGWAGGDVAGFRSGCGD